MDSETSSTSGIIPNEDELDIKKSDNLRQVWMLAFSLAILQVGFGIVTPIFPFYIIELGATALDLGILAASFAFARILLAGPLGGLSDRIGRKPVLMYALFGFAAANVAYAFAPNIIVMIIARAIEGAVSAGFYPAANAFVSDMTTIQNRGTAMGYLSTGNMVGFIVGPTVGGVLAEFLGIRMPFIIAAIASIGTLMAITILVREPEGKCSLLPGPEKKIKLLEVLSNHSLSYNVLALAMFINMFAIGILEVAFMLDAVIRYSFTPLQIGIFFGVLGIVMILGNVGFGHLSDRIGRKWLIAAGSAIASVALLFFILASDVVGFYFAGSILGVAISMRGPSIQALIADLTDNEAYGVVMGFFGAVSNSAYVVGPLLGGYLFDTHGDSTSSLVVAAVVSFGGFLTAAIGLPSSVTRESECIEIMESNIDSQIDDSLN